MPLHEVTRFGPRLPQDARLLSFLRERSCCRPDGEPCLSFSDARMRAIFWRGPAARTSHSSLPQLTETEFEQRPATTPAHRARQLSSVASLPDGHGRLSSPTRAEARINPQSSSKFTDNLSIVPSANASQQCEIDIFGLNHHRAESGLPQDEQN